MVGRLIPSGAASRVRGRAEHGR
eukprot:SAG31_NODE_14622_length_796_cov_1.032999_1_plen_22_part_10